MDERLTIIAEMLDREFEGKSLNGPSLMETLRGLTLEQVRSTATQEGYSVFGVALHLALYKHMFARILGADPGEFPYQAQDFPAVPEPADQAAWTEALERLVQYHRAVIDALGRIDADSLDGEIAAWKVSRRVGLEWYATHDIYHNAQIRNMGVGGL